MNGELIVFLALSVTAIMGGMFMLHVTKVMHMMLALMFTFLSIAGLYFFLWAEFVGVAQILIYSGAITIIMIFGIMLTQHNAEGETKFSFRKFIVLLSVVAFGAVMYFAVNQITFTDRSMQDGLALHQENTRQIGTLLYTKYIIPFELTSVVLLVALVGAIVLAKKDEEEEDSHE